MKQVYIIFHLILCSVFVPECLAHTPDETFGNMTYMVGDEHYSVKVTLADGQYRDPLLCVYYEEGGYVHGDFNNDGMEDAAVVITDSGGGSANWLNLAFLINDGENLVHRSSYCLGYKPNIISLAEEHDKVVIDMMIRDESTWAEGVMKRVRNVYEYSGPQVWGPGRTVSAKDNQDFSSRCSSK